MTDKKKINTFLLSFLLGGIAGGTIALLYAPKSGRKLRDDISRKTNELIDESRKKAGNTWSTVKEKAESTMENTLESANNFLNTSAESISRKAAKIKDAILPEVNTLYEDVKPGKEQKTGRNSQSNLNQNSLIRQSSLITQSPPHDQSSALAKDSENIM